MPSGSIVIFNAWAGPLSHDAAGHPYRDDDVHLVCTLCGEAIVTCTACGRRFQSGQSIEGDECVKLRLDPKAPRPPPPVTWWERFLTVVHLRVQSPAPPEEETDWVSVPGRPHRCRMCNPGIPPRNGDSG